MVMRTFLLISLVLSVIFPSPPTETEPIHFLPEEITPIAVPARSEPLSQDLPGGDWLISLDPPEVIEVESTMMERPPPQWSLPADWDLLSRAKLSSPHHDYPAADLNLPVGTPVFALTTGTILSATPNDGGACGGKVTLLTIIGTFMYCHMSGVTVRAGDIVEAGYQVGFSGGRPGAYGAGSSTVPHLHIGYSKNGRTLCPQPVLLSVWDGEDPNFLESTRCVK